MGVFWKELLSQSSDKVGGFRRVVNSGTHFCIMGISGPSGFLLYLATEKTTERLSVATLSLPKRSYEHGCGTAHRVESK
jgi:hypothetical protein